MLLVMQSHVRILTILIILFSIVLGCKQNSNKISIKNTYPWCIVAYDSLERTPRERINMMKDLGFTKYAYDWRDRHLPYTKSELILAQKNNIEIISVWIWLNPKRDSVHKLSPSNEKMFNIIEGLNLKTTIWVGLSENYFKEITHQESLKKAIDIIKHVAEKANRINCEIGLYNHKGWFGNPLNQIEIIKALPKLNLSIVYNFHHGHANIDNFKELAPKLIPYLSAVNLNGMQKDGEKIIPIGKGDFEIEMINELKNSGFTGPWGILGHIGERDVETVLKKNIEGLMSIQNN